MTDISLTAGCVAQAATWLVGEVVVHRLYVLSISYRGLTLRFATFGGGLTLDRVARTVSWPLDADRSSHLALGPNAFYRLRALDRDGTSNLIAEGYIVVS